MKYVYIHFVDTLDGASTSPREICLVLLKPTTDRNTICEWVYGAIPIHTEVLMILDENRQPVINQQQWQDWKTSCCTRR